MMAEETDFFAGEIEKFKKCSSKLSRMVFRDSEDFRRELNLILDELNSIEYSLKIAKEEVSFVVARQAAA